MKQVLYAKVTKERKKEFQICTRIILQDGKKYAEKSAIHCQGEEHVMRMMQYSKMYQFDDISPVECEKNDNAILFPFVNGKTMSNLLCEAVLNNDKKKAYQIIFEYRDLVYRLGEDSANFVPDVEFQQIFGELKEKLDVKAGRYINIDNILENIIKNEQRYTMIDYEWYFDFYIPYDFVVYRAILDMFTNYSEIMNKMFSFGSLLKELDITEAQAKIYEQMNFHFNEYVFGDERGYQASIKKYELYKWDPVEYMTDKVRHAQLYYDIGNSFNEGDSIRKEIPLAYYKENDKCFIEWDLSHRSEVLRLRCDPLDISCCLRSVSLMILDEQERVLDFQVVSDNGIELENDVCLYLSDDPQIVVDNINGIPAKVKLSMCIESLNCKEIVEYYNKRNKYIERLKYNNEKLVQYVNNVIKDRNSDE